MTTHTHTHGSNRDQRDKRQPSLGKQRKNDESDEPPSPSKLALASPESVVERQLLDIAALESGLGEYIIAR